MAPWLILAILSADPPPLAPPENGEVLGPHDTVQAFLELAHDARFDEAAAYLSLDRLSADERAVRGPVLARRLMFLLDQHFAKKATAVGPADRVVVVGMMPLGKGEVPVEVVRGDPRSGPGWRFSWRTVQSVDPLFAQHGSVLFDRLPRMLVARGFWVLGHWQWLGLLVLVVGAFLLARVLVAVAAFVARRLASLSRSTIDDVLVDRLRAPVWLFLFMILAAAGSRTLALPDEAQGVVNTLVAAGIAAAVTWALFRVSHVVAGALERRARQGSVVISRGLLTRITVLQRVVDTIIIVVGGAIVLLQFPVVRSIGVSLLASAGVVGVVVGLAAQRSIGSLLAGIQLSVTEPIRIGDTVVVEGEFGQVEEITLTYVVVKVWDLRRLVIPIGNFLEKPFQSWTRHSSEILGTVELKADFSVDVAGARAELARVVEPHRGTLWNGKVQGLQVTEMTERTVTLRALVSADDASKAWDLRCVVREQMLAFLTRTHALPRLRAEPTTADGAQGPVELAGRLPSAPEA